MQARIIQHTSPDILLTDLDVARLTGRARKTLQKDRLRGGSECIPFIRLGRLVRYRQSDVAAYIAARPTLRSTSDQIEATPNRVASKPAV